MNWMDIQVRLTFTGSAIPWPYKYWKRPSPEAFILSPPGEFVVKDSEGLILLGREKAIGRIKGLVT